MARRSDEDPLAAAPMCAESVAAVGGRSDLALLVLLDSFVDVPTEVVWPGSPVSFELDATEPELSPEPCVFGLYWHSTPLRLHCRQTGFVSSHLIRRSLQDLQPFLLLGPRWPLSSGRGLAWLPIGLMGRRVDGGGAGCCCCGCCGGWCVRCCRCCCCCCCGGKKGSKGGCGFIVASSSHNPARRPRAQEGEALGSTPARLARSPSIRLKLLNR